MKKSDSSSKIFCIVPWVSASITPSGEYRMCCASSGSGLNVRNASLNDYWNSQSLQSARKELIHGRFPKACGICKNEEASGMKSRRVSQNLKWAAKEGICAGFIGDKTFAQPLELDLKLENTCNLKCRMCSPTFSSEILKEGIIKESRALSQEPVLDKTGLEKLLADTIQILPDLKSLYFTGGEPTMSPTAMEIMATAVSMGVSKNIRLKFYTNLSTYNRKFFELCREFKFVEYGVSIDATGELNDYIRHPSKWSNIVKNFDRLAEHINLTRNGMISVNVTLSWYNVLSIVDLLEWLESKRKDLDSFMAVRLSLCHHPLFLDIALLPDGVKIKASQNLMSFMELKKGSIFLKETGLDANILRIVNYLGESKNTSWAVPEFFDLTQRLDKYRAEKFSSSCPDLSALLSP